jgi:hypothetical protein
MRALCSANYLSSEWWVHVRISNDISNLEILKFICGKGGSTDCLCMQWCLQVVHQIY